MEKKLQDAQRNIEELHKEKDALQTRISAVGVKERITPSKRGKKFERLFSTTFGTDCELNVILYFINFFIQKI